LPPHSSLSGGRHDAQVDLVADLGEGFGAYTMGDDEALLEC
jgi:lactam utilization protein B